MKTSTNTLVLEKLIGEEKAVEEIAKAGFDGWDFSIEAMKTFNWKTMQPIPQPDNRLNSKDYLKFVRSLKRIGEDNGIRCNQTHAPFPVSCKEIRDLMKFSLEVSGELVADVCVIHPNNDKSAEENAEMFFELLPVAKACNVKIATENMFNWSDELHQCLPAACATPEDFVKHLDVVNDPFLVACLDLGHAEIVREHSSAERMIYALGHDRLKALHIHDNDKIHDSHQIPFSMKIDFEPIVRALKSIKYDGYFTLECDTYKAGLSKETVSQGLKAMHDSVQRLADMYEEF